jgi:hypothetical protein
MELTATVTRRRKKAGCCATNPPCGGGYLPLVAGAPDEKIDMNESRTIVIIGTTLARELEGTLPAGWQLLLISEESYTTFKC